MKPALCVAVVSMLFGVQLAHAACPSDAVFLDFGDQIRGYSLRANGATEPCQVLRSQQLGRVRLRGPMMAPSAAVSDYAP